MKYICNVPYKKNILRKVDRSTSPYSIKACFVLSYFICNIGIAIFSLSAGVPNLIDYYMENLVFIIYKRGCLSVTLIMILSQAWLRHTETLDGYFLVHNNHVPAFVLTFGLAQKINNKFKGVIILNLEFCLRVNVDFGQKCRDC